MHNFQENISTFTFQSSPPGALGSVSQKFILTRSQGFTRSEKASRLKSADKRYFYILPTNEVLTLAVESEQRSLWDLNWILIGPTYVGLYIIISIY
jgi:hypothetical protein